MEEDKKPAAKTGDEDEDTSDVEIEGLDLDDDKEADDEDDDDDDEMANAEAVPESPTKEAPIDEELQHQLEEEEAEEMEAARIERMELMQAAEEDAAPTKAADKLEFLLGKSEVFAHFMAGSVAASDKRKKKGGTGKSSRGRMTEAEEDEQLLKTAASKRRGVVRLEKQPALLAEHCKMHKYQIEGLNFMIQLHDHGIHGILADEMGLGKTLQTISLLAYLREARGMKGPHLVVVPKSVVGEYFTFALWICAKW